MLPYKSGGWRHWGPIEEEEEEEEEEEDATS
jgi:hypothetical protein